MSQSTKSAFAKRCLFSLIHIKLQCIVYDVDHSDKEDRWYTLGRDVSGNVLVVIHTAEETNNELHIRIISARLPRPIITNLLQFTIWLI